MGEEVRTGTLKEHMDRMRAVRRQPLSQTWIPSTDHGYRGFHEDRPPAVPLQKMPRKEHKKDCSCKWSRERWQPTLRERAKHDGGFGHIPNLMPGDHFVDKKEGRFAGPTFFSNGQSRKERFSTLATGDPFQDKQHRFREEGRPNTSWKSGGRPRSDFRNTWMPCPEAESRRPRSAGPNMRNSKGRERGYEWMPDPYERQKDPYRPGPRVGHPKAFFQDNPYSQDGLKMRDEDPVVRRAPAQRPVFRNKKDYFGNHPEHMSEPFLDDPLKKASSIEERAGCPCKWRNHITHSRHHPTVRSSKTKLVKRF